MTNKMTKLMLATGAMALTGLVMAANDTATMGVSAGIDNECAIGNVVGLTFGDLSMLSAGGQASTSSASTGGGTFDVICTNGSPAPKLNFTSANSGAGNFRLIGTDAMTVIVYTIYESNNTAIAHGTNAAFTGFSADGAVKSLRIKGSIAASEKALKRVQEYSDTITITSSFTL